MTTDAKIAHCFVRDITVDDREGREVVLWLMTDGRWMYCAAPYSMAVPYRYPIGAETAGKFLARYGVTTTGAGVS